MCRPYLRPDQSGRSSAIDKPTGCMACTWIQPKEWLKKRNAAEPPFRPAQGSEWSPKGPQGRRLYNHGFHDGEKWARLGENVTGCLSDGGRE